MDSIRLRGDRYGGNTIISNCFIDNFLADANEAQIKIYLYLTRCIGSDTPVDVSSLADRFNYTEKDVVRALSYWAKVGIVTLNLNSNREINGITLNDPLDAAANAELSNDFGKFETVYPAPSSTDYTYVKEKPAHRQIHYSPTKIDAFGRQPEVKELIFAVETYTRRTLSRKDVESLLFMYDELKFPGNMIEFLVEHCIESGASDMSYFLKVAFAWNDNGLKSLEEAKEYVRLHNSNVYAIIKEFGITDRSLTRVETDYMEKWSRQYGFDIELIKEAAARTIKRLSKPSFTYADSILSAWYKEGVKSLSDIALLDKQHMESTKAAYPAYKSAPQKVQTNRFKNFSERDYDMDALERELTTKSMAKAGKL